MTNGQPPPPKVTDLQADKDGPLCPDETVKFEATTSPPSATVTWKEAVNGGEPEVVEGDGNTLEVHSGGKQTVVVTAELTNSLSRTVTWKVAGLKVNVPPGPNHGDYVITDEPRMPVITATALIEGGSGTVSEWEGSVAFGADDCPPFGPDDLKTILRFAAPGGNQITVDFGNVVRGGSISISAKGIVNDCTVVSNFAGGGIVGTNPQRTDIQAALPHHTLRRIACKESGQRQFDAPPDGGTDFCPLFGPGGKVGIMQIAKPTDDEVWNWKLNVAKGTELFNEKVDIARDYPSNVRDSDEFKRLVRQFNQKRQGQGLKPIEVTLLDFATGNFDDNLQQLELDAIRGYNGWNGPDRFGLGLHEFRVAVELVDGEEVLAVANVNEETLQGEAVWERVPVADRPADIGSPNYVEEVLAFSFDCTPATVPCNLTGISPATLTHFVGSEPAKFIAEGTGLAKVRWRAPTGTPATGTGATFTTKWRKPGKNTVTATCGGTTKNATVIVLDAEIQINNTESAKDDLVRVKCDHPPRTFEVPCRIKLIGPATTPVKVILQSLDHRLTFPPDKFVKDVELPPNGDWKDFKIAGENASTKIGDAKILVQHDSLDVAEKKVTVFSFDEAHISLKKGGNYRLKPSTGGGFDYDSLTGKDVSLSATARIRPAGLDCTAPQIVNLRIGIMQEVENLLHTITWDTPTISWNKNAKKDDTIEVETELRYQETFDSTVIQPVNCGASGSDEPLLAFSSIAKPLGCAGAVPAVGLSDSVRFHVPGTHSKDFSNAKVTWTRLVNATQEKFFTAFCVVIDSPDLDSPDSKKFCALRQAHWTLNVNSSGPPADQHAIPQAEAPVALNPKGPPPNFSVALIGPGTVGAVGTGKKKFTFPSTK